MFKFLLFVLFFGAVLWGINTLYKSLVLRKVRPFKNERGELMKGTSPTFIVGDLLRDIRSPPTLDDKPSQHYGTVYYKWFLWRPTVIVVDHDAIQRVLVANKHNYAQNTHLKSTGISASDYHFRRQNDIVKRMFSVEHKQMMTKTVSKLADTLFVNEIVNAQGDAIPFDLQAKVFEYARETIGELVYGDSLKARAIITGQRYFLKESSWSNYFPPLANLFPRSSGLKQALDSLNGLPHILSHPQEGTITQFLRDVSRADAENLTPLEIQNNAIAMSVSGVPAIAAALTSVIFMLIKHQDVQEKLRKDLSKAIGSSNEFSYAELKKVTYLTNVIKEALRLCPPYPMLMPRMSKRSDRLGGFFIPPKTDVVISAVEHNRHPGYWANPDEFNPERFENNEKAKKYLIAWSGGEEKCVGRHMGMLVIRVTLAALIKYRLVPDAPGAIKNTQIVRSGGTLKPSPPLVVKVTPA